MFGVTNEATAAASSKSERERVVILLRLISLLCLQTVGKKKSLWWIFWITHWTESLSLCRGSGLAAGSELQDSPQMQESSFLVGAWWWCNQVHLNRDNQDWSPLLQYYSTGSSTYVVMLKTLWPLLWQMAFRDSCRPLLLWLSSIWRLKINVT